jgi:hypothetical protein
MQRLEALVHRKYLLPALVLTVLATACSSHRAAVRIPRTGEISFRLTWEGDADLDLHVLEPGGGHTGFTHVVIACAQEQGTPGHQEAHPVSEAGVLDIDCNSSPDAICARPVENIFWPLGSAPTGGYEVWAQLFRVANDEAPVPFRLEIREGQRVRHVVTGTLDRRLGCSERVRWDYVRGAAVPG